MIDINNLHLQYLTNAQGEQMAVVLPIQEFNTLIAELKKGFAEDEIEKALLEARLDLKQGNFSKDDIDAHVAEMFD